MDAEHANPGHASPGQREGQFDWTELLVGQQLDWWWRAHLRPQTYDYPGDAATALDRLDAAYALWADGARGLGPQDLLRPAGPAEGQYASSPMAGLVAHINREALHHGAEIALLRDLYQWKEN